MPGKNGLELLGGFEKGWREDADRADFRASEHRDGGEATKLGRPGFLEKPLSTDKLLVTVENGPCACRGSRMRTENCASVWGSTNWWASGPADEKVNYANRARGGERDTRVHSRQTGTGKEWLRAPSMENLRGTTIRSSR